MTTVSVLSDINVLLFLILVAFFVWMFVFVWSVDYIRTAIKELNETIKKGNKP